MNIEEIIKKVNTPIITERPTQKVFGHLSIEEQKRIAEEVQNNPFNPRNMHKIFEDIMRQEKNNKNKKVIQDSKNVELPSTGQMVQSFAQSMLKWTGSGFKTVDEEQLKERLEICSRCEFWDSKAFGNTGRCQKCGCSTQAKLRLATEKCPIDRWGPTTTKNSPEELETNQEEIKNAKTEETQSSVSQQTDGGTQESSPEAQG